MLRVEVNEGLINADMHGLPSDIFAEVFVFICEFYKKFKEIDPKLAERFRSLLTEYVNDGTMFKEQEEHC